MIGSLRKQYDRDIKNLQKQNKEPLINHKNNTTTILNI